MCSRGLFLTLLLACSALFSARAQSLSSTASSSYGQPDPSLSIPSPQPLEAQSIVPQLPPSSMGQPQESTPDSPLYTEAQAQAAIQAASEAAAKAAVAEAVPAAVEIALKDYSRREGLKLGLWRAGALSGVGACLGSILWKGDAKAAALGAIPGLLAGAVWWAAENWPPWIKQP